MAEGNALSRAIAAIKRWSYESFGRDRWQQPDLIVRSLRLTPGARVADLGSGGGYFTLRLARAVGPAGMVYAVDVDGPMLADLGRRAEREGFANVRTVETAPDEPSLPETVDLIFLSHAYHHLADRPAYFRRAGRHLKPGGRVAIVEGRREGFLGRVFGHATDPATIQREMDQAGYLLVERRDARRDSFSVFAPAASAPS